MTLWRRGRGVDGRINSGNDGTSFRSESLYRTAVAFSLVSNGAGFQQQSGGWPA